ncbi:MAG TPA: hypothetical protein VLK58_17540, partial [Conexibacter sp.]|nr:hypothetical protein [Conexibacter sp.]
MPKTSVRPTARRRAAVATALLSAGALLASAPGASAGWAPGPAFTLPRAPFSTAFAAAPDGSATAAWVAQTGPDSGALQAQRISPSGVPGPVQTLDEADPSTVTDV